MPPFHPLTHRCGVGLSARFARPGVIGTHFLGQRVARVAARVSRFGIQIIPDVRVGQRSKKE